MLREVKALSVARMSSGATPAFSCAQEKLVGERDAEFLAAGGLRRPTPKKRMRQQFGEQRRVNASPLRQPAAVVVVALAARNQLSHAVHHHVARARVEGDQVADLRPGRHPGHVRDAADVLDRAAPARMAEEQEVGVRDQRRAFAAGGDVARAEVGHSRDSGPLGDHGRFADLERGAGVLSPGPLGLRKVTDRLPVRADQVNRAKRYPAGPGERDQRPREQFAEEEIQPADLIQPSRLRLEQGENALPDFRRIGERAKCERANTARCGLHDRGGDAVSRRAGHQPGNPQRLFPRHRSHFLHSPSLETVPTKRKRIGIGLPMQILPAAERKKLDLQMQFG